MEEEMEFESIEIIRNYLKQRQEPAGLLQED